MTEHVPVLLPEVLGFLKLHPGIEKILDCTLGLGGYSEAVLNLFPEARVWGIDQDEEALSLAGKRLEPFGGRFQPLRGNFGDADQVAGEFAPFDAILFDIGVSNLQISEGRRGFSFQSDGPLDMRMDTGSEVSAATIVNRYPEKELALIFWKYGEERFSRQIARGIVLHRQKYGDITTTGSLVSVIRETLPAPVQRKMGGHPARRVFQALRIAVNDELAVLEQGLEQAYGLCGSGSVIVVVSYHSLEDRIVKNSFRERQKEGLAKILTRRPVIPSEEEVEQNYKARSAKLRAVMIQTREGKEVEGKW